MDIDNRLIDYKNVEIHRRWLVALKNVNLHLDAGEVLYVIGKVGSGKSSLLKSLYAEVPIAEGEATVLGRDLKKIKGKDIAMLRRNMGVVFQDFQLLTDRTVHENLEFVLHATGWKDKYEIEDRINSVLKEVGMGNKSYKMPHELSGGEQQRIVMARAMLNRPALIIADEPTGNLDPETGTQIIGRLHEIAKGGVGVIIATHNLSLLEKFPARMVKCENKTLIDIDVHNQIPIKQV